MPHPAETFDTLFGQAAPVLALAPMQDVTDLPFLKLMADRGGADLYFTEYFRIHASAQLERHTLRSITENPTGRPILAQLIGNDPPSLARAAKELQAYPVAGIDLNLGCPAPVVYRKCAGGGLLREPALVDRILGTLREAVRVRFTVKTRIGFDDPAVFGTFLEIFARHGLDLLTVHGRTVLEMYRPRVHHDRIAEAVRAMRCPVLANGGVDSPASAMEVLQRTGARGLMIGRGAIRNPWLFGQIRAVLAGGEPELPTGRDVLAYVRVLWETTSPDRLIPAKQVQKLKKYLNFIGEGVEPTGSFLHAMRRVGTEEELFRLCGEYLDHDRPLPLEAAAGKEAFLLADGDSS
ncbi:MAG: tRNA dihydrouridine synthase [Limisphaerales bacterium]